jgi:hypothetical protein
MPGVDGDAPGIGKHLGESCDLLLGDQARRPATDQQRGQGDPPHVVPPHGIRGVALLVGGEDHRPVVRQVSVRPFGGRARRVQREGCGHVLQNEPSDEPRAVLGEQVGDGTAERVTHDVGAGDAERAEEGEHVVAHGLVGVSAGPVAAAVPAQVGCVHPAWPGGQRGSDLRPVCTVGPAGVQEYDGRRVLRPPDAVGQGDAVRPYGARFGVHAGHGSGVTSADRARSAGSRGAQSRSWRKRTTRRTNHSGSSSHG